MKDKIILSGLQEKKDLNRSLVGLMIDDIKNLFLKNFDIYNEAIKLADKLDLHINYNTMDNFDDGFITGLNDYYNKFAYFNFKKDYVDEKIKIFGIFTFNDSKKDILSFEKLVSNPDINTDLIKEINVKTKLLIPTSSLKNKNAISFAILIKILLFLRKKFRGFRIEIKGNKFSDYDSNYLLKAFTLLKEKRFIKDFDKKGDLFIIKLYNINVMIKK